MNDLYYAMGYCGSGVGRYNYFGRKIAEQVINQAEGKTSFDEFPFKTRPFYTGTPWFMSMIMKWHDFADRRDW